MARTVFLRIFTAIMLLGISLFSGCVQRELTINTVPSEARVFLNDEEIGTSPVTVNFEWYGDFSVRLEKLGYQTLATHRAIKRPRSDYFPFDLLYDMFGSNRINSYEWSFKLSPYAEPNQPELIKKAETLRAETTTQLAEPVPE